MPPQPPWHARIPEIRATVAALAAPVLDRASVERVFGVERRTAQRLLRSLDGHLAAHTALVGREAVLALLDGLLAGKAVGREAGRKQRLGVALAELERAALPKAIPIGAVTAPEASWPEGVALTAPDALTIRFTGAEELLGRILAITELAARDYAGFAARLASLPAALEEPNP